MERDRKLLSALLAGALLVGASGCSDGNSSDGAEDEAAEEAELTQEVTVDPDGNVRVTDSDGNVNEFQTSNELPADWPEGLEPPESVVLVSSNTTKEDGLTSLFVTATTESPLIEMVAELKRQLDAAGFELLAEAVNATESGGASGNLGATKGDTAVNISLASEAEGPSSVLYSVTIQAGDDAED